MYSIPRTLATLVTAGSLAACTMSKPVQSYQTPLNKDSKAVRSVETDLNVSIGDAGAAITHQGDHRYVVGCSSMRSFDVEEPGRPSLENSPLGQATVYLNKKVERSKRQVQPRPNTSYRSVDPVTLDGVEERVITECTVHQLYE